ncbi:MAG: hypothetical protein IJ642_06400 [Oscillospiraceae bacterium]|nr:hypothetical protein [Oscillospiraceae bacterium]
MVNLNDAKAVCQVAKELAKKENISVSDAIEIIKVTELGKIKLALRVISREEGYDCYDD